VREERAEGYSSLIRFAYCKKMELLERASAQLKDLAR
jgi:N-succinyldiaminopimelate aminotransferase